MADNPNSTPSKNTTEDSRLQTLIDFKNQAAAELGLRIQEQHQSLLDSILPAQDLAEQARFLAANAIEGFNAPAPIFDASAYEPPENYYQSIADMASYRYEEKYREQERLARLIAEEFIEQLEERNRANFPEESRGRTPDFAYEWAYQQYKQGRERRHIWIDFVDIFLDDPALSPDELRDIKKAFNKAIDRRRKQEKLD